MEPEELSKTLGAAKLPPPGHEGLRGHKQVRGSLWLGKALVAATLVWFSTKSAKMPGPEIRLIEGMPPGVEIMNTDESVILMTSRGYQLTRESIAARADEEQRKMDVVAKKAEIDAKKGRVKKPKDKRGGRFRTVRS